MGFKSAKQLGACLARDYSEAFFRLLVNYRDIAASEAASRLGIHIRTAQDFLETLAELDILEKDEVFEGKRPYYRYSLAQRKIGLEIDLETRLSNDPADDCFERRVRERKGSGAQFATARSGKHIELDVKEGDVVLFAKYAGTEIKCDGKKLLIMRESDLLAVLDE